MGMCGIKISLGIFALFLSQKIISQCQCVPFPTAQCGQLNVGFSPGGGVEFCEGTVITFTNTSAPGFDYFVIKWEDNAVDTVYNYNPINHIYVVPDTALCLGNRGITVCFKGIKDCANGTSCASGTYDFTLKVRPKAMISMQSQYCIESPVSMLNSSCNAETYLWNFGDGNTSTMPNPSHTYSTSGLKNISLIVGNSCGSDTAYWTFQIVTDPLAQVNWTPADDTICIDQTILFNDATVTFGTTTWIFPPVDSTEWMLTDTLMNANSNVIEILYKQAGVYTIQLKASNACGMNTWTESIVVLDGPTVSLVPGPDLCISNAVYDPFATYTGQNEIQSYLWTFQGGTPSTSSVANPGNVTFSTPGNHTVTLQLQSECGTVSASTMVTIDSLPVISMPSVPPLYCSGSSPDTLIAQPPGGIWSGQGISSGGIFNPGNVPAGASYTLTYTVDNDECEASSSVTVMVVSSQSVSVEDEQVCEDAAPFSMTAIPAGGLWTGGPFISTNGTFNPAISGTGTFLPVYHYMDGNGCPVDVTATVIIQAFPLSMMSDTTVLCNENIISELANVLILSLTPGGGDTTWTVNGVPSNGTINGAGLLGFQDVLLTYMLQSCLISDSAVIEFIASTPLVISADTTICINDGIFQLQSNLSGTWSGPGVNPSTGIINLNIAGGGNHFYTFVHQAGTSCEQSEMAAITVNDPGLNLTAGQDVSLCFGEVITYTFQSGLPVGGLWSGTGISNPVLGILDVSALQSDTAYIFNYCLELAALPGCMACDDLEVVVHSLPDPGFLILGSPCEDFPFAVIVDTCVTGTVYTWSFGDGNTVSGCSVVHTYTTAGDFMLSVLANSTFGCDSSHSQSIHVTGPPVAAFDLVTDEGCAPFIIDVLNTSSGEIAQQLWIIGQDSIPGANPGLVMIDGLTKDSLIVIQLQVSNGCASVSDFATAFVHPYPVVDFGFNVDEGCSPLYIEFGNTTLGNPETWAWNLGNGMISSDSIPPPQYYTTPADSVSIYNVMLISTNACGSDTLEQAITVFPPDVTAFIQMDTISGCQPLSVPAHSFSTPGSQIGWQVIGPNGQVTGSIDPDPVFLLDQPGIHTIILTAARCGMDFDTAYVDVLPAPLVDFQVGPVICEDEIIQFQNLSQDVTGVEWDFGDGIITTDFNPVHQYLDGGIFVVSLSANSAINNCPNTKTLQVNIVPKPILDIDLTPQSGCPPLDLQFNNFGPSDVSYVWIYKDGTPLDTNYSPSHVFVQSGTYPVDVFAYDAVGCLSDTLSIPVQIYPVPVSQFDVVTQRFCERHDTIFTDNQSQGAVSYYWLVNGNTTGPDPLIFLPDSQGVYDIHLVAENSFGCRDTAGTFINVLDSPAADFLISDSEGCAPLHVFIENQSTGSTQYAWSFGDGNSSTDNDPAHTFQDSGMYQVTLIALQYNGCPNDTAKAVVNVFPVPVSGFSFSKQKICGAPMEVQFENTSTGALDYTWTFGDGQGSALLHPGHTYKAAGIYQTQLIVNNIYACADTSNGLVEIYEQPLADFSIPGLAFCEDELISIVNQSVLANTYCWLLDTVLIAQTEDLQLFFPSTGSHSLSLIAKYNEFCADTFTLPGKIDVYITPNADFNFFADQIVNILGDVQFQNLSTEYERVFWNFGDGLTSTQSDPFHEYDINRGIEVILKAYHDNGGIITCSDSIVKIIAPEWLVTFFAPNAFSPDHGDSLVRVFKPVGIGLLEYDLSVYSPWGQRVWHTTLIDEQHPAESWNGRLNNTDDELPQGAYSWIARIEFVNGESRVYKGSVTLLR